MKNTVIVDGEDITLLHNRVLVQPDEAESITKGGIIIPDNAKEKLTRGRVLAVGADESMVLEPGDRILYGKYAGTAIEHGVNKQEYMLMRETDVLAVINENIEDGNQTEE